MEQISRYTVLAGLLGSIAACGILLGVLGTDHTHLKSPIRVSSRKHPVPPALRAADHFDDGKFHLLVAATGSVATIKLPNILQAFSSYNNISIRVLLSESAAKFLQAQSGEQPDLLEISTIRNVEAIYLDEDEWRKPWVRGDPILHIELRRWADMMVIAPLSANSLAKIAGGIADNLVTSVVRAWDTTGKIDFPRPNVEKLQWSRKQIVVAPAMNTAMWAHPVTEKQIHLLEQEWDWITVLRPMEKELACGDTGTGAMKDWRELVAFVKQRLELGQ